MAETKLEVEKRLDRQEKAILKLAEWTSLEQYRREIEDILHGTETTSETGPDAA